MPVSVTVQTSFSESEFDLLLSAVDQRRRDLEQANRDARAEIRLEDKLLMLRRLQGMEKGA